MSTLRNGGIFTEISWRKNDFWSKNASCSRFSETKILYIVMIDHLSRNPNPSCSRWVENVCIEVLEKRKLFSLFFLSYSLQCKVSALELENVSRMTSQTFFKHQFGIRGLKSKTRWVQIRIPPDGVKLKFRIPIKTYLNIWMSPIELVNNQGRQAFGRKENENEAWLKQIVEEILVHWVLKDRLQSQTSSNQFRKSSPIDLCKMSMLENCNSGLLTDKFRP